MAKQYYNLEEAAQAMGVSTDELNAMRERGELRAFADRGTWKFRVQDIEQASQQGAADDSAITLGDEFDEDDAQVLLSDEEMGSSDSSFSGTVTGPDEGAPGDSDVQLVPGAATTPGSDSDVSLFLEEAATSDSDVSLSESAAQTSDSDVDLADLGDFDAPVSDSDVNLADLTDMAAPVSDSDVNLAEPAAAPASDSDVRIDQPIGADTAQSDSATDFELALGDSGGIPGESSGAEAAEDSSLVLGEVADSEISIAPSDSGISLGSPSDSGISLEQPPSAADTETLEPAAGDDLLETDFEVPVLDESGLDETDLDLDAGASDFDLGDVDDALAESGTEVIAVEGEEDADAAAATTVADTSSALLDEVGASGVDVVETFDDEAEAPYSEEVSTAAAPMLRTQETEWGTLVFSGLLLTSVLTLFCGFMMFGLVHSLWTPTQPFQPNSFIMDLFAGK